MSEINVPEYYADGLPVMTGDVVSKIIATSIFYDPETEEHKKIPRVQIVVSNQVLLSLCFNVLKGMKESSNVTIELRSQIEEMDNMLKEVSFSKELEN
jgi:hypothetical protein